MQKSHAIATQSGLKEISHHLETLTESERNELRSHLRIGIQWYTEVTDEDAQHLVTQVYCSALPCINFKIMLWMLRS